jgi:uncharacterized protein (TIGR02646 family)
MRTITKGPEPTELTAYRAVPGATYDGKDFTPVKDKIRDALGRDQLALCCYCLRRMSKLTRPHPTTPSAPPLFLMKVEHWRSQAAAPALQLAWTNMLGACPGGEGGPRTNQTCDTRKGEDAIVLSPLDPTHIATLRCTSTGRLESTNPQFQDDINERLNLNHGPLVEVRKRSIARDLMRLKVRYPASPIPESAVRRLVTELEAPAAGKLPELCSVVRLWARKRYGGGW